MARRSFKKSGIRVAAGYAPQIAKLNLNNPNKYVLCHLIRLVKRMNKSLATTIQ
jgi:hypothetical protein